MDKKNTIISTKTFEEFKTDNATYYKEVVDICNDILKHLREFGANHYNDGLILAGKWDIEGNINTSDLTSHDETLSKDLFFHNIKSADDYITVDISGRGTGEPFVDTEKESAVNLDVNSITYFHDGADFTIAVTTEIEKIILEIIEFIAK